MLVIGSRWREGEIYTHYGLVKIVNVVFVKVVIMTQVLVTVEFVTVVIGRVVMKK